MLLLLTSACGAGSPLPLEPGPVPDCYDVVEAVLGHEGGDPSGSWHYLGACHLGVHEALAQCAGSATQALVPLEGTASISDAGASISLIGPLAVKSEVDVDAACLEDLGRSGCASLAMALPDPAECQSTSAGCACSLERERESYSGNLRFLGAVDGQLDLRSSTADHLVPFAVLGEYLVHGPISITPELEAESPWVYLARREPTD
ncbi:MAG: hypothetical protein KC933_14730 [Myxococcales bacterium]|nr:hypothetical protein [Myxococcales bacterium]